MARSGNKKKYIKSLMAVFLSLCTVLSTVLSTIQVAHAAPVKLSELPAGTVITIGGHSWNVLDPATGYLQSYHHVGDPGVFDPDNTNRYNPADTNNIAYYLNNTFYNSLTAEGQAMILNHTWSTGDQTNENASSVTCKVGVIGKTEFYTYEPYMSHVVTAYFWSRTPFSGNTSELYVFNPDMADNEKKAATAWSYMVPTVYISPNTVITDTMRNHTVTASMNNTSWGSVSFNGKFELGKTVQETFAEGASVTVTAVPLPGYKVASWTLNGSLVSSAGNTYTFTNGSTDTSVVANFEAIKYQVTVKTSYSERGSVSGSGQYTNRQDVTISATPNPGYLFSDWFYEDSTGYKRYLGEKATYSFPVEAMNYTLTAVFVPDPNANVVLVELYATYGGTASGGGMKQVGSNVTVTAVPYENCRFVHWEWDGTGTFPSDATSYTFKVPSAGVSLRAYFELIPLKLTAANPAAGERNKAYNYKFTTEGGLGTKAFAVAGTLPAGLSLAPDGTLSGTPTTIGTYTFTVNVMANDEFEYPVYDSKEYTMTINEETLVINKSNLTDGTVGTPYTHSFTATGGKGAKSFAVTAGALPDGLSLATDGTLSGTPSATGTKTFTVTVTDSATPAVSVSNEYTLAINMPLAIDTNDPVSGTVGTPYNHSFTATGGAGAKSFAVTSGALPEGLTLAPDGTLSGTPTKIETSHFTVTVTDSATLAVTKSNSFTMTINPAPLAISKSSPAGGTVETPYTHSFTATGGTGEKSFAVTLGTLPAGLSLASDGTLSGTPLAIETSTFTVTVNDSASPAVTVSNSFTMIINPAPLVISKSNPASGTVGTPYTHNFTATGGTGEKSFAVTLGTLPEGLLLADNGTLSGTPTTIGTSNFTVTVSDRATPAVTDSSTYSITIDPETLVINISNPASGTVGTPYTHTFTATGGTGAKSFAVTAEALPDGLLLATNGTMSGTPSAAGTKTFTVTVTDNATPAVSVSNKYTLTINMPLAIDTNNPASGTVGTPYTHSFTATGGSGTKSFAVTTGDLPEGLLLAEDGSLSGTPSAIETSTFTVTVTDSASPVVTVSNSFTMTINPAPLVISKSNPAGGTDGTPYSHNFTATGGTGAKTYAVTTGALPEGLSLAADGTLSGTPSAIETRTFTVTVTDSASPAVTVSNAYTITINPALLVINKNDPAGGTVGTPYTHSFTARGGTGAKSFAVTLGTLPDGLALASDGKLSGTPTMIETCTFTVTVSDSATPVVTDSNTYTITINPVPLAIEKNNPANGTVGTPYTHSFTATGGTDAKSFAVTLGTLPDGLALASDGKLSGTPTKIETSTFTVTATDSATPAVTVSNSFTMTINPAPLAISKSNPAGGTVGTPYTHNFTATGGTGAKSFAVTAGALPEGLSLAADGTLSGTPSAIETRTFTVTVTDSASPAITDSNSFTMTINPSPLAISKSNPAVGTVGTPYTHNFTATGGTGTKSFAVTSGTLPEGLTLAPAGTLSGTPTKIETSTFTVTVSDSATTAVTDSSSYTIIINEKPANNGGGASSGGPSSTTPSTTTNGSTATTTATAKTGTDGKAAASVTQSQLSDALDKAKAAAGTNGKPAVKIQIDGATGANSVGMTIPQASVKALVSGNAGALTISSPTGAVTFDAAALKTISGASSGDVTFTTSKVDTSTLPDTAKQVVGSHPVYEFSVTSGGNTISQFGGSVTVSVPYTPAAGEDTNAIVIYYIAADGKLTMVPDARYDTATGMVVFTTTHFSTYAVGYNKMTFTDVIDTAWYSNAVTFLAARGITSGTTATSFSPDESLTRGQFITMLLRAYSISPDLNPTDNFADSGNTYYTGYLAAAKRMGITSGIGDNLFAPDRGITRQEMFTLLYSALKATGNLPQGKSGKTLADFSDTAEIASWAKDAMTLLVETGAVSGSSGKLSPTSATTRAEMAQVLYSLLVK